MDRSPAPRPRQEAGIVSRGYGARGGPNDEARELAWKLPGVPHVQDPDRVAAARRAIREFGCQVLVLDDAFQHRRIGRDLDIVLLDALEPLGYEHVFPRGTLREPVEGLARADVVALSRADLLTADQRGSNPRSRGEAVAAGGVGRGRACTAGAGGGRRGLSGNTRPAFQAREVA